MVNIFGLVYATEANNISGHVDELNKLRSTLSDSHRLSSITVSDISFQTMQFSTLKFVAAVVVAISFTGFTQAVSVLVRIQSLLYSLISRVVPYLYAGREC